jgi:hypothetical protein
MPTYHLPDETPVVQFDPLLELSPFDLFRRLREARGPRLVDVRPALGTTTLAGAEHRPDPSWEPEDERETLLFDDDGTLACAAARRRDRRARSAGRRRKHLPRPGGKPSRRMTRPRRSL